MVKVLIVVVGLMIIVSGLYFLNLKSDESRELKSRDCPKLGSSLEQLTKVSDPAKFASEHLIYYTGGRSRVDIELTELEGDLVERFDLEVEVRTRQGMMLQVLVPIETLCELSKDPRVKVIQVPSTIVPD